MNASQQPGGAIVVVAKCPIPNKSKTRLIPLLGEEGSAKFAKALLSDVLVSLSTCVSRLCRTIVIRNSIAIVSNMRFMHVLITVSFR